MNTIYKIHPAIGVARLGNSDQFYLGPECTGGSPIQCNPDGSVTEPEQPVTEFKETPCRIKRQAARFRVFVYDDRTPGGRELQIGDRLEVTNQNSGQVLGGTLADIVWTVYLANKKASWYEFDETDGEHGYAPDHPLRNASVQDANLRQQLIIDPGPQTVAARGAHGVGSSAEFSKGKNPGMAQTFPPPLTPHCIDTLGEIRCPPQGNYARLVVLGGRGNSGSAMTGLGQPAIDTYANNDGWFDDISDGPVTAQLVVNVTSIDGQPTTAFPSTTVPVDDPAWVIVGYPRYAPQIVDIVTLDDVVYDVAVRSLAYNQYMYGIPPFTCDAPPPADLASWRRQAQWNPDYRPYFWRDIWPILKRPIYYQFVMNADPMMGGDPHQTACGAGGNMDPQPISIPPFNGENPQDRDLRRARRLFVYQVLRKPGGENSLTHGVPGGRAQPNYGMPFLCGDNPITNVAASKFLRLTDTMLFMLRQWAEGKFINEQLEQLPPAPPQPGVELDRGSLGNMLGGAFCPGGECGWIIRNPAIYSKPYRINQAAYTPGALSQPLAADPTLNNITPASLAAGLEPGDLTKYDAVPWQADFNECSTQSIDITYEDWSVIYPASTGDPVVPVSQLTYWWPAHRPMNVANARGGKQVQGGPWSPTPQTTHVGDLQMVTEWSNLGFVLQVPAEPAGIGVVNNFYNVVSGKVADLPPS